MKIALVLVLVTFGNVTLAKALAPSADTGRARQLLDATLAADTGDQIDQLIDLNDRHQVTQRSLYTSTAAPHINFEGLRIYQQGSVCDLSVEVDSLNSISTNAGFRDLLLRLARWHCMRNVDFKMNSHVKPDEVQLARDAFTCGVSGTKAGYAGTTTESKVGLAGTVVRHRLFLPDRVTNFDNRETVVTSTPGRNPRVDFTCRIHPNAIQRQAELNAFRQEWKIGFVSNLREQISKFEKRDRAAEEALDSDRRVEAQLNQQIDQTLNQSTALVAKFETCMNQHRIADRYYRELKIEFSRSSQGRICPKIVASWSQRVQDERKATKNDRTLADSPNARLQSLLDEKPDEECQSQIKVCKDWSVMGVLTDFGIRSAPDVWKQAIEAGKAATRGF